MSNTVISAKMVGELRQRTGGGLMDCKRALTEASGDFEKAVEWLRKKGMASADKKSSRGASEGLVEAYIHTGGKVGVLMEVNCETDFVAKNDDFKHFVRDLAMHVAASSPVCISREEIDPDLIEKEKSVALAQAEGKPEVAKKKIVQGKIDKYLSQVCLLEQPYIKDQDLTVDQLVKQKISKMGENIVIKRFARFKVGEL